ncbi:MAG: hypothetical protein KGJ23_08695 [Euryarchaeota archaeon]|nr:hypothetical protein [Euryarchaeota archaeon]MDE1836681.1 hypothetical protein [Euryarchaeota archaeon]MDE1880290.1 hypothetical protein [Euryarchaeota archaeon]MDE2044651.1 hypothetical protein [Thermoplasmata archaeon]
MNAHRARRLRMAGIRSAWFAFTWDPKYLERFGVGEVINEVVPVGCDLDPWETASLVLSEAEVA